MATRPREITQNRVKAKEEYVPALFDPNGGHGRLSVPLQFLKYVEVWNDEEMVVQISGPL